MRVPAVARILLNSQKGAVRVADMAGAGSFGKLLVIVVFSAMIVAIGAHELHLLQRSGRGAPPLSAKKLLAPNTAESRRAAPEESARARVSPKVFDEAAPQRDVLERSDRKELSNLLAEVAR